VEFPIALAHSSKPSCRPHPPKTGGEKGVFGKDAASGLNVQIMYPGILGTVMLLASEPRAV
jgi:hypothetical protein